jgi:hypothetical protein
MNQGSGQRVVLCMKWGTKYGPEYVNRLYAMVRRNITGPFRLVCLTDDRHGIRPEVECFDLPELGVPHPQRTMGKWRKQILWGASVPGRSGPPNCPPGHRRQSRLAIRGCRS